METGEGMHVCTNEKVLGELSASVKQLVKEIFGNGTEGLAKTIPRLETQIKSLTESVNAQAKAMSALAKTITEIDTTQKYKDKKSEISIKKLAVILSSIIGISSILVTIIIKLIH